MSRQVQFVTPENIEVTYELAGIGSRFIAALIDHLLQILAILAVFMIGSMVGSALSFRGVFGGNAPLWVDAALWLIFLGILFGYFSLFELLWAGRTPGKRIAGLRVVRDSGYPIDLFSSLVRNFVRIVDFGLPPPYGAGLVSIFASRDYKRLGDFAAGTIVIRERSYSPPAPETEPSARPLVAIFMPMLKDVSAISGDEFQLIRRFNERRTDLEPAVRGHVAMRLAMPLLSKIGFNIIVPVEPHFVDLLEAIERRYVEERGAL